MSHDLSADDFLRHCLHAQTRNIQSYTWCGERVWVKKAGPRNAMWRYRVLGAVAGALGLSLLRPVPNLGGTQAIAIEAARLTALRERGLAVPQVLAHAKHGLLLRDLRGAAEPGGSLEDDIRHAQTPAQGLALFAEGAHAIARVHARGAYLSQAFARNLVRTEAGEIGYLDFEDDPAAVVGVAAAQARDWLCYLHSTAVLMSACGMSAQARRIMLPLLRAAEPAVRAALHRGCARLAWLRHLPKGKRLGRDGQRLQAVGAVLQHLKRELAPAAAAAAL